MVDASVTLYDCTVVNELVKVSISVVNDTICKLVVESLE